MIQGCSEMTEKSRRAPEPSRAVVPRLEVRKMKHMATNAKRRFFQHRQGVFEIVGFSSQRPQNGRIFVWKGGRIGNIMK